MTRFQGKVAVVTEGANGIGAAKGGLNALVRRLASEDASFITGTALTVDGGWSVHH